MHTLPTLYPLTNEQIAAHQENGYVKLKQLLSAGTLADNGDKIAQAVRARNTQTLTIAERNTYAQAFLQIANLWEANEKVKEFVMSNHRAGQNNTDRMRAMMTIIYMEDGMCIAQPKSNVQQNSSFLSPRCAGAIDCDIGQLHVAHTKVILAQFGPEDADTVGIYRVKVKYCPI